MQKTIKENRECVTIHPMVSCAGEVVMGHVIFGTGGITSHMAPSMSVKAIPNLLISTTENGVQDHNSLLEFYKQFNKCLLEKNIVKPVVVLTDGHTLRFDEPVLSFCNTVGIHLFVGPPDTTGVTQLLDQINHSLHHQYREGRDKLFSPCMKID